jgi:hypothetical protein
MTIDTTIQDHERAIKAVVQATNLPQARVRAAVQYWQATGSTGANITTRTVILCYRSVRLALEQQHQEAVEEEQLDDNSADASLP